MKVFDLHCDTLEKLYALEKEGKEASLIRNDLSLDGERMRKTGYIAQNFAIWVDLGKYEKPYEVYREMVELFRRQITAGNQYFAQARGLTDTKMIMNGGRMAAFLTVEGAGILEGSIDRLEELYKDGVRMMSLTWNYNNQLGTAAAMAGRGDFGLTSFGKQVVERMEEMKMMLDVSHLSDKGILDVLEIAKKPFVASHSNCRELCPMPRNLPDTLISQIANRGGLIGLNYFVPFLVTNLPWNQNNRIPLEKIYTKDQLLDACVQHVRHLIDVGGLECVALGSDFDGIDPNPALPEVTCLGTLYDALRRSGLAPSKIDRIFYANSLRLYQQML